LLKEVQLPNRQVKGIPPKLLRFDVLLIDEAPLIPAAYLLAAAALTREKIILSGNTLDIPTPDVWASPLKRSRIGPQASPVSS